MAILKVVQNKTERGCEGRLSQKIRVEVVEGYFPHISVYIIISKVNIFY